MSYRTNHFIFCTAIFCHFFCFTSLEALAQTAFSEAYSPGNFCTSEKVAEGYPQRIIGGDGSEELKCTPEELLCEKETEYGTLVSEIILNEIFFNMGPEDEGEESCELLYSCCYSFAPSDEEQSSPGQVEKEDPVESETKKSPYDDCEGYSELKEQEKALNEQLSANAIQWNLIWAQYGLVEAEQRLIEFQCEGQGMHPICQAEMNQLEKRKKELLDAYEKVRAEREEIEKKLEAVREEIRAIQDECFRKRFEDRPDWGDIEPPPEMGPNPFTELPPF